MHRLEAERIVGLGAKGKCEEGAEAEGRSVFSKKLPGGSVNN